MSSKVQIDCKVKPEQKNDLLIPQQYNEIRTQESELIYNHLFVQCGQSQPNIEKLIREVKQCIREGVQELGIGYREAIYQSNIKDYLERSNWTVEKERTITIRNKHEAELGWHRLDLIATKEGYCVVIELKRKQECSDNDYNQLEGYAKTIEQIALRTINQGPVNIDYFLVNICEDDDYLVIEFIKYDLKALQKRRKQMLKLEEETYTSLSSDPQQEVNKKTEWNNRVYYENKSYKQRRY